jgi:hypothetical protein
VAQFAVNDKISFLFLNTAYEYKEVVASLEVLDWYWPREGGGGEGWGGGYVDMDYLSMLLYIYMYIMDRIGFLEDQISINAYLTCAREDYAIG